MINYDPEEYKEAASVELSIQHMHDGTTKLKCWSYSITRLPEYKRVKHCLTSIIMGRLKSQDACRVEASGSSLSAPPAVPKTWKVDDFQSMPLRASN